MLHLIIALVLMGRNKTTTLVPSEEIKREQTTARLTVRAQDSNEGLWPKLQSSR
jgi:hypothetical protein